MPAPHTATQVEAQIAALQVTWEIHKAQLSPREMSYGTHARLWDWIFEHERREDEDEFQAPRLAELRAEWERRRSQRDASLVGGGARAAAGVRAQQTDDNGERCRTRLVAADDESYLMVPDVRQRAWE